MAGVFIVHPEAAGGSQHLMKLMYLWNKDGQRYQKQNANVDIKSALETVDHPSFMLASLVIPLINIIYNHPHVHRAVGRFIK